MEQLLRLDLDKNVSCLYHLILEADEDLARLRHAAEATQPISGI